MNVKQIAKGRKKREKKGAKRLKLNVNLLSEREEGEQEV
jgi:hypothetical protein